MKITTEMIMQIAELNIPPEDALWVLIHRQSLDASALRLSACDFAERVLPIFEARYPGDKRPRMAIDAARKYAADPGEKNKRIMDAASAAAYQAYAAFAVTWAAEINMQIKLTLAAIDAAKKKEK